MASEFPLSLKIQAIDNATATLRQINSKLTKFTKPVRDLSNKFKALSDEAGLPRMVKGFSRVGQSVGQVGSEALSLGLKLGAMATGAVVGFYAIVKGAVDAGDKLGEMAQRVGLSADAFAQLQFAAAQADVEQEAFNAGMDQFNKRLGEAKAGGGPLLDFLNKVSPAFALQVKGANGTEEALALMAGAFERLQDPAKIAALSAATFGKSGLQMGQWLHGGNKALAEARAEFAKIAGSQEEFAQRSGLLDNAMRRTGLAIGALRNAALSRLFPALVKLSDGLTDLIVKHSGKVVAFFEKVGTAIGSWVDGGGIQEMATQIGSFVDRVREGVAWVGGWGTVLAGIGAIMAGPLLGAVGGLISSVLSLGGALLATPFGWVVLGVAAAAAGIALLYSKFELVRDAASYAFGPLIGAVKELWGQLSLLAELLAPILLPLLKVVAAVVGGALLGAVMILAKGLQLVVWLLTKIVEGWTNIIGFTSVGVQAVGEALGIGQGPSMGATAAAPPSGGTHSTSSAKVVIDINGAPRGTTATTDPSSTAPLDLSMGYSMFGG